MTRGSLVVSTPSPSIQVPIVNRYGSQILSRQQASRPFRKHLV